MFFLRPGKILEFCNSDKSHGRVMEFYHSAKEIRKNLHLFLPVSDLKIMHGKNGHEKWGVGLEKVTELWLR